MHKQDENIKHLKYTLKSKDKGVVLLESIIAFGNEDKPFPKDWKDCPHTQRALDRYKQRFIEENFEIVISEDLDFELKK